MIIQGKGPLKGELRVPGDKSISHRAVMFGSISEGTTRVRGFLHSADCLSTISCFRSMGTVVEDAGGELIIRGKGLHGLLPPEGTLDAGNSGTTTRLLGGILAGQRFPSVIDGDLSLRTRPMRRIMDPLSKMGAMTESLSGNDCLPLRITPPKDGLSSISFLSPVASAQVKSCILLAGLYAKDGPTSVTEPSLSRDHTERMLSGFGARVLSEGNTCTIWPDPALRGTDITVPGDISSAAYFIAAALITPGSEVFIRNVGINPTRSGLLEVIRRMGGDLTVFPTSSGLREPTADLLVRASSLKGTVISGSLIPTLIDELPVIAVMAAFASGTTVIRDAAELRVKESDRITAVTENLTRMGGAAEPAPDGMTITGGAALHEASVDSFADHRIAMSFACAAMGAGCSLEIRDAECVGISYPGFYSDLEKLSGQSLTG